MSRIELRESAYGTPASVIANSHTIMFGGIFTCAGGDTVETIPIVGGDGDDVVCVQLRSGAAGTYVVSYAWNGEAIDVTLNQNPVIGAELMWMVARGQNLLL